MPGVVVERVFHRISLLILLFTPIAFISLVGPETRYDLSLPVWRLAHEHFVWVNMSLVSNVGHFLSFLLATFVCLKLTKWHPLLLVAGLLVLSGFSEFVQLYVPGRDSNLLDVLVNISGVLTAVVLSMVTKVIWSKQIRPFGKRSPYSI